MPLSSGQRTRHCRRATLSVLPLERRCLLTLPSGTFAVIDQLTSAGQDALIRFNVNDEDFFPTIERKPIWLTLTSSHQVESGPDIVEVKTISTKQAEAPRQIAVSANQRLVRVRPGAYLARLTNTPDGISSVTFALTGDVDGNFRVDSQDLRAIRAAVGQRAGEPGYNPRFDLNADGQVGCRDLVLARANRYASTSLRPIELTIRLPLDPDRNNAVTVATPTIEVDTSPLAVVSLDIDKDGADEQVTSADAAGDAVFAAHLGVGKHALRIEAAETGQLLSKRRSSPHFGQRRILDTSLQVTSTSYFSNQAGYWQFIVNGSPFYAQGITGDIGIADPNEWTYDYLNSSFSTSNANVLRTYGVANTAQLVANTSAALAWAASQSTSSKPVMVLVGLYLPADVSSLKAAIDQIAADPNSGQILGWCVGNEVATPTASGGSLNATIDALAAYIKTKSAAPVCTAVPNATSGALQYYASSMPNLDWIGINSFYGQYDSEHVQDLFLGQLDATMAANWSKPWAVTEFYSYDLPSPGFGDYAGMPSQTLNGTPYYLELNSTANARNYAASWSEFIVSQAQNGNVGGFALNWMPPHNSQVPAYWKDMFVYRGAWQIYVNPYGSGTDRLEAVDVLTKLWGGTPPSNATPQIVTPSDGDLQGISASFKATLTSPGSVVSGGQTLTASVIASDTDTLTFDWYLIGGTNVTAPSSPGMLDSPSDNPFNVYTSPFATSILLSGTQTTKQLGTTEQENTITFTMPKVPTGNVYQLRVIIRDGQGGAATAAIAFAT